MFEGASKNVGGTIGFGLGVLKGFIVSNIGKVSEQRLKEEIEKNARMMLSWVGKYAILDDE